MLMTPAPAALPAWGDHNVHLWWCDTPAQDAAPQRRRARLDALLREVLARYLGTAPERLRFGREARGRPYLLEPDAPDFNLSDTDGGSVIAVAQHARVGVDLEREDRQLPHRRLAQRYFAAPEIDALRALPDDEARRAFLRLWTAKEASCKATGTGIYGQLDRWTFASDSDTPHMLALPGEAGAASSWHHLRFNPAPGYTAVLACAGWKPSARGFRLDA